MDIKRTLIVSAAVTSIATAGLAQARTSSEAEFRGYQNCLENASEESRGLVASREYLINKDGANTTYYVNATRWNDGERESVRIACETANRGVTLVNATTLEGRYTTDDARVTVEVAKQ